MLVGEDAIRFQVEKKQVKIFQDETKSACSQKTSNTNKNLKKKLTPAEKKAEKDMKKRTSEFLNTTRWLPDSSFTTYFGKPAFHSYGRGNTEPVIGGVNYGHSLLTHNINAECGNNPPLY